MVTQDFCGCFYGGLGFGSIYSTIATLLTLALLAGLVILVFLAVRDRSKKEI